MGLSVAVLSIVLAAWFLLSVVNQLPRRLFRYLPERVAAFVPPPDPLGLIPSWTFFAPNPGTTDTHLLYRYGKSDQHLGCWIEVSLVERWGLRRAIWNPYKREKKALVDHSSFLLQEYAFMNGTGALETVQLSQSYILILNFVSSLVPAGEIVQFLIMRSPAEGAEDVFGAEPVLVSFLHRAESWD